tara:strand:- start:1064 stop:1732 length:669 start_codon:yes stop_codon:yes gene_type:complete
MAALRSIPSLLAALVSAGLGLVAQPASASLFQATEVDVNRFILVAAPIGGGGSSQLNIYEQRSDTRPCYSREGDDPTLVNPLLGSFDFTGICSRYMDSNGYSVRIGNQDYGSALRVSIIPGDDDLMLVGSGGGGEPLVIARTGGMADGFLELKLDPGWSLRRRFYGERALGHLYLYRETFPNDEEESEDGEDTSAATEADADKAEASDSNEATEPEEGGTSN